MENKYFGVMRCVLWAMLKRPEFLPKKCKDLSALLITRSRTHSLAWFTFIIYTDLISRQSTFSHSFSSCQSPCSRKLSAPPRTSLLLPWSSLRRRWTTRGRRWRSSTRATRARAAGKCCPPLSPCKCCASKSTRLKG
jgi:hypothetical protein